jgi:hypothetical protein
MQNVERCIVIASQQQPAVGACVDAVAQGLLHEFAAGRALLGRVAGVHQHNSPPSFFRFGDGHADKLAPRHIQDAFTHPTASAHLHRSQILKHDHLIGIYQLPAALVGEVRAPIDWQSARVYGPALSCGGGSRPTAARSLPRLSASGRASSRPRRAGRSGGLGSRHPSRGWQTRPTPHPRPQPHRQVAALGLLPDCEPASTAEDAVIVGNRGERLEGAPRAPVHRVGIAHVRQRPNRHLRRQPKALASIRVTRLL